MKAQPRQSQIKTRTCVTAACGEHCWQKEQIVFDVVSLLVLAAPPDESSLCVPLFAHIWVLLQTTVLTYEPLS